MAIFAYAVTGPAVTAGNTTPILIIECATAEVSRMSRLVCGQTATTTSGQARAGLWRGTASGTTLTTVTPEVGNLGDAANVSLWRTTTNGVAPTLSTNPFWSKSFNVLTGCEQSWAKSGQQGEWWLPPNTTAAARNITFQVEAVGAGVTPRYTLEVESIR